jgi:hypothetical protein
VRLNRNEKFLMMMCSWQFMLVPVPPHLKERDVQEAKGEKKDRRGEVKIQKASPNPEASGQALSTWRGTTHSPHLR